MMTIVHENDVFFFPCPVLERSPGAGEVMTYMTVNTNFESKMNKDKKFSNKLNFCIDVVYGYNL